MKILISWVATNNDYLKQPDEAGNWVDRNGTNFNFHRYCYDKYDKHIILTGAKDSEPDARTESLLTELRKEFKDHTIESRYMNISDVISLEEIKTKVEGFLITEHKDDTIDIFFSPGTSIMQVAWYIIHNTAGLKTRLLQVRPGKYSKSKEPELLEIITGQSTTPYTALVREGNLSKDKEDYLITESLAETYERANKIAQTDAVTTLITGESGTGKEHLARYIHDKSVRSSKKFVAINCSAFTDELLESRLFGHKKGAFTGASSEHTGLFEEAKGGTIFLDEIGDISPYMQQVLLRVLQQKVIMKIGENEERKIDVRIIAATNRDIIKCCRQGDFRWDLYYRLAVAELTLLPLRERPVADRERLIDFFLKAKKELFQRSKLLKLNKETRSRLLSYPFPGNVRELENTIEQLYVFNDDQATLSDLPARIVSPEEEMRLDWKSVEKIHIQKVLRFTGGIKKKALEILGYKSINTLTNKIKEYNIEAANE